MTMEKKTSAGDFRLQFFSKFTAELLSHILTLSQTSPGFYMSPIQVF